MMDIARREVRDQFVTEHPKAATREHVKGGH
jgi:hypothetical protein